MVRPIAFPTMRPPRTGPLSRPPLANRPPQAWREAQAAADLARGVVLATVATVGRRRVVSLRGWQAIAAAADCNDDTIAIAAVHRRADGVVLAECRGIVGAGETAWHWRPEDERAEQAQRRAIARAAAAAFGAVAAMIDPALAFHAEAASNCGGRADPNDPWEPPTRDEENDHAEATEAT